MIAIIKYNAGNLGSISCLFENIGEEFVITDDAEEILKADKVILPGVGEASTAMKYLTNKGLDLLIPEIKKPFLGICLGMQIMCKQTEENNTPCLGIFDQEVRKFPLKSKVPHMGWNNIYHLNGGLFDIGIEDKDMYFVHSYYAEVNQETCAKCNYIMEFSAAIQKGNFYGVQFHPEKSSIQGRKIIQNFLNL